MDAGMWKREREQEREVTKKAVGSLFPVNTSAGFLGVRRGQWKKIKNKAKKEKAARPWARVHAFGRHMHFKKLK